jgi:GTP-binding protein Era
MKCGFVSLVGRPNVGKSSLLNSVLGMKLAITSNVSGTTRNVIQGIYNDEDSQIIFVDTPGIHKPSNKLGSLMNKKAYNHTEGVDVILFLVDISKGFGRGDQFILDKIKDKGVPIFLLLNKIDLVKNKEKLLEDINQLKELYDFAEIIPISAIKQDNIKDLINTINNYL